MPNDLTHHLHHLHTRRLLRDAALWLPRGLLAGLLLAALVALAARLWPILDNRQVALITIALALAGLVVAALALFLPRRTLLQQARFADRHFHLQERATAAVEIAEETLTVLPHIAERQLQDTLNALAALDPASALPLRLSRRDWLLLLPAIALLVAAILLPNPQVDILQARRAVQQTIAQQEEQLEQLIEEIEENPALTAGQQEQLTEPLRDALQELQQGDLTREEAVAVLSEAEAELRDLYASNSNEALQRELQSAAAPLANTAASQSFGASLQSGDLSQAGHAAAALADALPGLSPAEQAALAQSLQQSAAALANVDGEISAALAAAAAALEQGDLAAAQEALRQAAAELQERAQEQAAAQQAAAAAGQLGEGRQQVAQAGSGQQPGQGEGQGQGQGESQGQGQGQGQGSGEGQGDGSGSGQGNGSGSSSAAGGATGGTGGESGHAEELFFPGFVDLSGEAGEDVELPAECIANPDACGGLLNERPTGFGDEESRVPYTDVFPAYRDAAYQALETEPIPLGMKGLIRDYFSSLETGD